LEGLQQRSRDTKNKEEKGKKSLKEQDQIKRTGRNYIRKKNQMGGGGGGEKQSQSPHQDCKKESEAYTKKGVSGDAVEEGQRIKLKTGDKVY